MAIVAMMPQVLYTIALTAALIAGWDWGVRNVLLAYVAASFVGLGIGYLALARPTRRLEDELDETELWRTSRHAYVSSVRPLDSVGLDRILVGGLIGSAALGLYTAAAAVSNLCRIVGNAVSVIVLPRVAMTHDDVHAQRAVVRRWVVLSGVLIALMVVGLELVVGPAIRLAFGEEFAGAIPVARWLIVADGLLGFRTVLIAVLQGQSRSARASWVELALTPVLVVGIVVTWLHGDLTGIGVTMVVLGVLSCASLGLAVGRRPTPRGAHRALSR
jgi:O-antigen/teichoic acid export membrane protein